MTNGETDAPSLPRLVRKLLKTGAGALQNRGELLQVELQQEKYQLVELLVWGVMVCFLGLLFLLLLTATIILLVPPGMRVVAAAGFALLYLVATVWGLFNLKALARSASPPFADTMDEIRKDREWLESLK